MHKKVIIDSFYVNTYSFWVRANEGVIILNYRVGLLSEHNATLN